MTREEYTRMWDPHGNRDAIPGYHDLVGELFDTLEGSGPNPYGTNDSLELYERRGEYPEFDKRILRAGEIALELTEMVRKNECMQ